MSRDSRFLDCVGDALRSEGMCAVSSQSAGTELADGGFRPRAIVVDPAALLEPHGAELVRFIAGSPALAAISVFSISPAAKRVEVAGLLSALHRLEGGDEPAYG